MPPPSSLLPAPASVSASGIVLRCQNLHRHLGEGEGRVHVLKGVSFEARRGQIYAIVGPSGCGKSTLLYLLGLLDQPDEGRIEIDGRPMSNSDDLARTTARCEHIGFVFQFHFLMLEFTALDNVMMPMRKLGRLAPEAMRARAHALLDSVGLGAKTHRLGTQLSGGEQQRVAIARAIAKRPDVLLCDEPTGALDITTGVVVLDAIDRANRELGTSTVVITHNAAIAGMADRVVRLADGLVVGIEENARKVGVHELRW